MRTNFEQKAHDIKRVQRPAWEHNIETYTDNNRKTDWFLIGVTLFLVGLGLTVLIIL